MLFLAPSTAIDSYPPPTTPRTGSIFRDPLRPSPRGILGRLPTGDVRYLCLFSSILIPASSVFIPPHTQPPFIHFTRLFPPTPITSHLHTIFDKPTSHYTHNWRTWWDLYKSILKKPARCARPFRPTRLTASFISRPLPVQLHSLNEGRKFSYSFPQVI